MRARLSEHFPAREHVFFPSSADMREYLRANLQDLVLISLDHDLELQIGPNGETRDLGTGREVADYLASCAPASPVIIHSTYHWASIGMQSVLREAGWKAVRIVPFADLNWIDIAWLPRVRRAISGKMV